MRNPAGVGLIVKGRLVEVGGDLVEVIGVGLMVRGRLVEVINEGLVEEEYRIGVVVVVIFFLLLFKMFSLNFVMSILSKVLRPLCSKRLGLEINL